MYRAVFWVVPSFRALGVGVLDYFQASPDPHPQPGKTPRWFL